MGEETIISAVGLSKHFNGFPAVRGVSFRARRGECLGILGPNGAGKTTLARMICCVSPPGAGILEVFGLPVAGHFRRIKARLGVCPQDDNIDPDLDVRQNLLVYAGYFGVNGRAAGRTVAGLLDFVGLADRSSSPALDLSGGMKRRLVFARALVNDPELLVLDEPTTGLDPRVRRDVWGYISRLGAAGKSFLLTTHYMEEAARLCDRVIIMDGGLIIAEGPPDALVEGHLGRTVIETLEPDGDLERFLNERDIAHETLAGRTLIRAADPDALHAELTGRFGSRRFRHRMADLEDVFLKLTGRTLDGPAGRDEKR